MTPREPRDRDGQERGALENGDVNESDGAHLAFGDASHAAIPAAIRHDVLHAAAGAPTLISRQALLEALTIRIDEGGADVADAPLPAHLAPTPRPALTLVPSLPGARRVAKLGAKVAGIGIGGWLVLAAGTAAAASAGAWLLLDDSPGGADLPTTAPSPTISVADTPVPPVTAPAVIDRASAGGLGGGTVELLPMSPERVVDGVLAPDGLIADTVAPVISAVKVSQLSGGTLNLLTCDGAALVAASISDHSGVSSAVMKVKAAGGIEAEVPMVANGETWSAPLAPIAALGAVSPQALLTVTVEASDAAGNTATKSATVPLSALACLG